MLSVEGAQYGGHQLVERVESATRIGEEHTGVPVELAHLHEHTCKLALRLLRERLHLMHTLLTFLAKLYVSVSRFGTRRLDAHGEHIVVGSHKFEGAFKASLKPVLPYNRKVRRRDEDACVTALVEDAVRSPYHARCRAAVDRFGEQPLVRKFGQLLANNALVVLIRDHIYIFFWQQACKTIIGVLQQCTTHSEEVDELLGPLIA